MNISQCCLCSERGNNVKPSDISFETYILDLNQLKFKNEKLEENKKSLLCESCIRRCESVRNKCFSCEIDFKRINFIKSESKKNSKFCLNVNCTNAFHVISESEGDSYRYEKNFHTIERFQCQICDCLNERENEFNFRNINVCKTCLDMENDQTSKQKLLHYTSSNKFLTLKHPGLIEIPKQIFFKTFSLLKIISQIYGCITHDPNTNSWIIKRTTNYKPKFFEIYSKILDKVDKQNNNSLYPDNYKIVLELSNELENLVANNKFGMNYTEDYNYSPSRFKKLKGEKEEKEEEDLFSSEEYSSTQEKKTCYQCELEELYTEMVTCRASFCYTNVCPFHYDLKLEVDREGEFLREYYCSESCLKLEIIGSFDENESEDECKEEKLDEYSDLGLVISKTLKKRDYLWKIIRNEVVIFSNEQK